MDQLLPAPAASTPLDLPSRRWVLSVRATLAFGIALLVLLGWSTSATASTPPRQPGLVKGIVGQGGLLDPVLDLVTPTDPATPSIRTTVDHVAATVDPLVAPVAPAVQPVAARVETALVPTVAHALQPVRVGVTPLVVPVLAPIAHVVSPIASELPTLTAPVTTTVTTPPTMPVAAPVSGAFYGLADPTQAALLTDDLATTSEPEATDPPTVDPANASESATASPLLASATTPSATPGERSGAGPRLSAAPDAAQAGRPVALVSDTADHAPPAPSPANRPTGPAIPACSGPSGPTSPSTLAAVTGMAGLPTRLRTEATILAPEYRLASTPSAAPDVAPD